MHTRIPQERRFWNPATDDELIKRELPMLRIEKESDGHTTTQQLSGRIQSANIGDIQAQVHDEHVRIFMDLGEVTLVDVEVVRFLSECEGGGIKRYYLSRKNAGDRNFFGENCGWKEKRIDRSATGLRQLPASIKGLRPGFHNRL